MGIQCLEIGRNGMINRELAQMLGEACGITWVKVKSCEHRGAKGLRIVNRNQSPELTGGKNLTGPAAAVSGDYARTRSEGFYHHITQAFPTRRQHKHRGLAHARQGIRNKTGHRHAVTEPRRTDLGFEFGTQRPLAENQQPHRSLLCNQGESANQDIESFLGL